MLPLETVQVYRRGSMVPAWVSSASRRDLPEYPEKVEIIHCLPLKCGKGWPAATPLIPKLSLNLSRLEPRTRASTSWSAPGLIFKGQWCWYNVAKHSKSLLSQLGIASFWSFYFGQTITPATTTTTPATDCISPIAEAAESRCVNCASPSRTWSRKTRKVRKRRPSTRRNRRRRNRNARNRIRRWRSVIFVVVLIGALEPHVFHKMLSYCYWLNSHLSHAFLHAESDAEK